MTPNHVLQLIQNEMGYFDTTKTGDISSRLSSDTTSVSDQAGLAPTFLLTVYAVYKIISHRARSPFPQISLNINVMMRSTTQAILVLVFMLAASWRLTTITFVLIPLVMAISSVRCPLNH